MPEFIAGAATGGPELSPAAGPAGPGPVPEGEHEGQLGDAVRNLRALILAGERYRQTVSSRFGLGQTESQAISYLAVHGSRGQSDLARDLSLTTSALTALVDRLERLGVAERTRHPTDRRRLLVRLTERGEEVVAAGQDPLRASLGSVEEADLGRLSRSFGQVAQQLRDQMDEVVGRRRAG